MEQRPLYIASCSFGKDSIATILLALEHNEPLDRAVFAEVMFDTERNISGEIPEHIEWIYSTAIPKLEAMGVKVDVVAGFALTLRQNTLCEYTRSFRTYGMSFA